MYLLKCVSLSNNSEPDHLGVQRYQLKDSWTLLGYWVAFSSEARHPQWYRRTGPTRIPQVLHSRFRPHHRDKLLQVNQVSAVRKDRVHSRPSGATLKLGKVHGDIGNEVRLFLPNLNVVPRID